MLDHFRQCDGSIVARVDACVSETRDNKYKKSRVQRQIVRLLSNSDSNELNLYLQACKRLLCAELDKWVDAMVVGDTRFYTRVRHIARRSTTEIHQVSLFEDAIVDRTFKSYSVDGLSAVLRMYTLLWVMEHESCSLQQTT